MLIDKMTFQRDIGGLFMSEMGFYSWFELSKALHDALLPQMAQRDFLAQDMPEDDPAYLIYKSFGDGPHHRRFLRSSPLGCDTMACRIDQHNNSQTHSKSIGIGLDIGVHIAGVERLELEIGASVNMYRIGKCMADIWHFELNLAQLAHVDEASIVASVVMEKVDTVGNTFWANHRMFDDVLRYFAEWSVEDRYSPKGAYHVSRYLMLIARLKGDRQLFEDVVDEYQPFTTSAPYETHFNYLVQELRKNFDGADT
jgi:hypothetical protein